MTACRVLSIFFFFVVLAPTSLWATVSPKRGAAQRSYELSTPWGEKVVVTEVNRAFEKEKFRLLRFQRKEGRRSDFLFSIPAWEEFVSLDPLSEKQKKRLIEDTTQDNRSVLLQLFANEYSESLKSGRCDRERLKSTILTQILLGGIEGPPDLDLYARTLAVREVYASQLSDPTLCVELTGAWLFFSAANPQSFFDSYSSLFPMAWLQSFAEANCEKPAFGIGIREYSEYACLKKIQPRQVPLIRPRDLAYPIIRYSAFIQRSDNATKAELVPAFYRRVVELGVYFPDIPLPYPGSAPSSGVKVTLSINGQSLGEFALKDVNPYLYDSVGLNKCRKLLTGKGVEEFCLKTKSETERPVTSTTTRPR